MDIFWAALGAVLLALGFVGCVAPMLPGVTLAYLGLAALYFTSKPGLPVYQLAVGLVLVIIATAFDTVMPALGTKKFGGTKWGVRGCVVGAVVGLFFAPLGIIIGPFVGALAGELLGGKRGRPALMAGLGAFLGFLCGMALKLVICGLFAIWFIAAFL